MKVWTANYIVRPAGRFRFFQQERTVPERTRTGTKGVSVRFLSVPGSYLLVLACCLGRASLNVSSLRFGGGRMLRSSFLVLLSLLCGLSIPARADEAKPIADDPVLEERVMNLSRELRCLVCQNETLADSRADLAVDLRNQVREQMKAGKSDEEIITFLTARYGDFVLYRPRVRPATYLLWFGPFLLLLAGLVILFRYVARRREVIVEAPLSEEERRRAESLLGTEPRDNLA